MSKSSLSGGRAPNTGDIASDARPAQAENLEKSTDSAKAEMLVGNVELKDPKKKIRSGFMWLGIASIFSQILDAVSLIVVMMFITKAEMGLATLAITYYKIAETFISFGVGKALVQDSNLTESETHSLFWFSFGSGVLQTLVLLPTSWIVAWFYGSDELVPLIIFSLINIIFLSLGEVSKKLVEKRLEYSKATLISVCSTLVSGATKIVLAVLGAGAWSLVAGSTMYGFAFFVSAFIIARYIPKLHFKWGECRRFVQFGIKFCFSNLIETLNRNIHYLIVGKFFGESVLGVYRVGYELAMTPALALLNVVNQSSYAVFAKIKDKKEELSGLFAWNQGNIAIFSAVPIVFILFCSADIFSLINDGEWMSATAFIPIALCVAFVKALLQTFPELYRACGKPGYSLRTDIVECVLICIFFMTALGLCALTGMSDEGALKVLFASWLAMFVPLFLYHRKLARTLIDTGVRSTLRSISGALVFAAAASGASFPFWLFRDDLPWRPWLHMGIEVVILLVCIGIYFKWFRKK